MRPKIKRLRNLEKELIKYNKFWLLIVSSQRKLSSAANLEKIKETLQMNSKNSLPIISNKFDNIFIFDSCFKEYVCIK